MTLGPTPNITISQEAFPVMYVLIRDDMRYENESVQAGHAVAEFIINHSREYKGVTWPNGTMVYLAIRNEFELRGYAEKLKEMDHKYSMFIEPDWGEPQATALATIAFKGEMFTELRTIKQPRGYFTWLPRYIYKFKKFFNELMPIS